MQKHEVENSNLITAKKATAMRKRQDAPNKELKHIEDALRVLQSNIAAFAASLLLSIVLAGRRLLAAKALLPHGEYTPWIEKNFSGSISVRTAQRYTTIAAFVENNMDRLRAELGETIEPGESAGLTDDEILLRLPASKVNELIAYDKKDSAQKAKPPVATRILTDRFASAITDFLGPPDLVLTTTSLGDREIEAQEIVTGKDPAKDRRDWPNTVVAVLADGTDAAATIEAICSAFISQQLREALLLISGDQLVSSYLIERPQLHFTECHPIVPSAGKAAEIPLTLLLISDEDRVEDFARSFRSLGIIKVPFVLTR